nr:zinc finger, CCHC-type [Tanacetum cinerariifolium]
MGDENPIRTLGDYSKPSHEGYMNTIELPKGNNVVPLRSDTIRLVQNRCSFHRLWSEDPNQHLKDFLKLVDSLDLYGDNRERTRLRLFQFSFLDQASNWLERLPAGSITTWEDFITRSLLNSFYRERLKSSVMISWCSDNIMENLYLKHGLTVNYIARGRLRKLREGSLDYENSDIEQLLGVMKCKVDTLMKEVISLIGRSESIFGMTSNTVYQLPSEPSRQEEFKTLVTDFILDQEEKVKQLEEYMGVIGSDFMQLSLRKLKKEIRMEKNKVKKIKKITRYPDTEDLEPLNECKFLETLTKKASFHTLKFVSPKSLCVKHVRTIFPNPPFVRESTFGFMPCTRNNQNIKSQPDPDPQRIPIEVEPLDETPLKDLGLNTCNYDIPLSSREIPNFDEPEPQPQPLPNYPPLDVSLGSEKGLKPPIKPYSLDSFRMKVVDNLTIHIPTSPYVAPFHLKDMYCYHHPCLGDLKKHYGFKPGLLRQGGSLGVDLSN